MTGERLHSLFCMYNGFEAPMRQHGRHSLQSWTSTNWPRVALDRSSLIACMPLRTITDNGLGTLHVGSRLIEHRKYSPPISLYRPTVKCKRGDMAISQSTSHSAKHILAWFGQTEPKAAEYLSKRAGDTQVTQPLQEGDRTGNDAWVMS